MEHSLPCSMVGLEISWRCADRAAADGLFMQSQQQQTADKLNLFN